MQIHCQNTMNTGRDQKIRDQLGRYRHTRFVFSILARVPEKRNHCGDAVSAGPSRCIDHDEQFHQMIVGWGTGGLNDENITPANVLLDSDVGLAVRECAERGLAQRRLALDLAGRRALQGEQGLGRHGDVDVRRRAGAQALAHRIV